MSTKVKKTTISRERTELAPNPIHENTLEVNNETLVNEPEFVSESSEDLGKKKKRETSNSDLPQEILPSSTSTKSKRMRENNEKRKETSDKASIAARVAAIVGTDSESDEDPKVTELRAALKPILKTRNRALIYRPSKKWGYIRGTKVMDDPTKRVYPDTDDEYESVHDDEVTPSDQYQPAQSAQYSIIQTSTMHRKVLKGLDIQLIVDWESNRKNLKSDGVVLDPHQQIDDSTLVAIGLAVGYQINTPKDVISDYIRDNEEAVIDLLKKTGGRDKSKSDTTLTDACKQSCRLIVLKEWDRGSVLENTIKLLDHLKTISADGIEGLDPTQHTEIFNFWKQNLFTGTGLKQHTISDKLRTKLQTILFPTGGDSTDKNLNNLMTKLIDAWTQYHEVRAIAAEWGIVTNDEVSKGSGEIPTYSKKIIKTIQSLNPGRVMTQNQRLNDAQVVEIAWTE